MAFYQEKMTGIKCDRCGKILEDFEGYTLYVDEDSAVEAMQDEGWAEIDGKHYCPDCYHYDDDLDEYVPKEKQ